MVKIECDLADMVTERVEEKNLDEKLEELFVQCVREKEDQYIEQLEKRVEQLENVLMEMCFYASERSFDRYDLRRICRSAGFDLKV